MAGLVLYGVSMAMMLRSGLELDPWDVLHYGVATWLPLTFGGVVIATGVAVLLLWIPLRQMPGLGTVANAVVIGLATDAALALLVTSEGMAAANGDAHGRHRAERTRHRSLHRSPARARPARQADDGPRTPDGLVGASGPHLHRAQRRGHRLAARRRRGRRHDRVRSRSSLSSR